MTEWMNEWLKWNQRNEWQNESISQWMNFGKYEMKTVMNEWMNECMDEWMNELMNWIELNWIGTKWMNECIN